MVASNETRKCVVHLLDDQKMDIPLQPKLLSSDLLDIVSSHFNLKEKEYFGLCYYDSKENLCWLRMDKKALDHDYPKSNPIVLYFRVRNYLQSINILKDNVTIELFYKQAQKLIFKGEIECDSKTVFLLAAYVLQATHGDYVSDSIAKEDLKDREVMPVRTLQEHPSLLFCEEQILDHYRSLDGVTRGEALIQYLNIVENLPMYGVHYYDVKDKEQIPWKLGLSYRGVGQYDFKDKTVPRKIFTWSQMENIFYRDKKFSLEYREGGRSHAPHIIKTSSNSSLNRVNTLRRSFGQRISVHAWYSTSSNRCREVWHMAVSQHKFFLEKRAAHKSITAQRSLHQMAKHLSRSSTSLASTRSTNSAMPDNISDTASFYFSLDGDSVSSTQIIEAEQDMLSALKARKMFLEQQLIEKRELLNDLCLREAELTGVVPSEMPESPTHPGRPIRRKVGTSFEFDQSLLNSDNNTIEGYELENLERDFEIQRQITSAAQRLAMDPSSKKKVRKARQLSYQKSLVKLKTMEQQLEYLKRECAKDSLNGISKLTKKDEAGGSTGDSLGPIDCDTSSSKSGDSLQPPVVSTSSTYSQRRPRDSMYLATPVITSSSITTNQLVNLKDGRVNVSPSKSSIISPRYDHETNRYLDKTDYNKNEKINGYNDPGLPPRTYSIGGRIRTRPPQSPMTRIKKAQFHTSADMLNELASPRSDDSDRQYICGEFENTGMYSINVAKKSDMHYSIPHSKSSTNIVQVTTRMHSSPRAMRRLLQTSLSPTNALLPSRYMSVQQIQSQLSLASSSESSEFWPEDVLSEETLV